MMRPRLMLAFAPFLFSAAPALACSPPPPADWEGWVSGANDIFAGRVASLTPQPISTEHDIRLRRALMRIERLKSFDERGGLDAVDVSVIVEVLDMSPNAAALCVYPEDFRPGDAVLVIKPSRATPRVFRTAWAQDSRFASLFEEN